MSGVSTIGLDLAKNVFREHGSSGSGAVDFRKKLRRGQVLKFSATQPASTVAMEACASSHYWGRDSKIRTSDSSHCAGLRQATC